MKYIIVFAINLNKNKNRFDLLCFNQMSVLNILVNKRLAALFLANRTFLKSLWVKEACVFLTQLYGFDPSSYTRCHFSACLSRLNTDKSLDCEHAFPRVGRCRIYWFATGQLDSLLPSLHLSQILINPFMPTWRDRKKQNRN